MSQAKTEPCNRPSIPPGPAEADMQAFFQITPPSVHAMVLTLARKGLIRRVPGQARSITLAVAPETLPLLKRP